MTKIFKLYETCRIVKGFHRSIICDLGRNDYQLIPNLLFEILSKFDGKDVNKIFEAYSNRELITEYIDFLVENNFAFYCDDKDIDSFSRLNLQWESPSTITNAIILLNKKSENIKEIFKQLEANLCKHILLILGDTCIIDIINPLLENSIIKTVDIALEYESRSQELLLIELISKNARIKNFILFSADENKIAYFNETLGQRIIKTTKERIIDCSKFNDFTINTQHFTESISYNTCLNRKVCIDEDGNIRNCPYMKKSYGNIKNTTLIEIISKHGFKKYWHIKKDDIDVCKDCEFRYICTDCRAFIRDPENIYSQPAKCGYNPYICKWQGQEGWISVEQWLKENIK